MKQTKASDASTVLGKGDYLSLVFPWKYTVSFFSGAATVFKRPRLDADLLWPYKIWVTFLTVA